MKKDGEKKAPMKKIKHMDVKEDKALIKDMVKPASIMKKMSRGN